VIAVRCARVDSPPSAYRSAKALAGRDPTRGRTLAEAMSEAYAEIVKRAVVVLRE